MTVRSGSPSIVIDEGLALGLDYRALFNAIPTPCAVLTVDSVICEVNEAYEQVVGRSRAELVGARLADAFPRNPPAVGPDAIGNIEASLRRVYATGRADTMDVQQHDLLNLVTGQYEVRYWSPKTVPLLHDGRVSLLRHRTEDVTD